MKMFRIVGGEGKSRCMYLESLSVEEVNTPILEPFRSVRKFLINPTWNGKNKGNAEIFYERQLPHFKDSSL